MIRVISPEERHFSDFGWLKTYWLFSFSDYYDPSNIQHGALRVFNDDVVHPGKGFPMHMHKEMEIVTIILEGELTHRDSMDNKAVITAGEVQAMSAGTGVLHSEYNLGTSPVHLYQIWIHPGSPGHKPRYEQKRFDTALWKDRLYAVASGMDGTGGENGAVNIHADAAIYRCELSGSGSTEHLTGADRCIFIYNTSGELEVNGVKIAEKAQARVEGESELKISAGQGGAGFILIDIPG